jgi:hypothetical protein
VSSLDGDEAIAPGQVLLTVSTFVGRAQELSEIHSLLKTTRLLTLSGVGGVGKTRLALRVAGDLAVGYPDGASVVQLAPVASRTMLIQSIAKALGVYEKPGQSLLKSMAAFLKTRCMLLVLDNCEHFAGGRSRPYAITCSAVHRSLRCLSQVASRSGRMLRSSGQFRPSDPLTTARPQLHRLYSTRQRSSLWNASGPDCPGSR